MEWRQLFGLTSVGFILGLMLGGFLWGSSSPEKKQDIRTLEVVRTVEVIREAKVVVTVEAVRTVIVEKVVKADRVIEEKKTLPDGTVTIRTETYNLGVTTREQENSTVHLGVEQSERVAINGSESVKETKLSVSEVSAKKFSLGVVALNEWNSLTQWSYFDNLAVVWMWHPADSFFVGAIAGPRYFGAMAGIRF